MGFLDFLKPRKPDDHQPTIADCESKLTELHEDRARAEEFLANLESRRTELLLSDEDPKKIHALDIEGDASRLRLEKLELFESEIVAKIASMRGAEIEAAWRQRYDAAHAAAMNHAEQMRRAMTTLFAYRDSRPSFLEANF